MRRALKYLSLREAPPIAGQALPTSGRASQSNAGQGYNKIGGGEKRIIPPTAGRAKSKQASVETGKDDKSPEPWRSRP